MFVKFATDILLFLPDDAVITYPTASVAVSRVSQIFMCYSIAAACSFLWFCIRRKEGRTEVVWLSQPLCLTVLPLRIQCTGTSRMAVFLGCLLSRRTSDQVHNSHHFAVAQQQAGMLRVPSAAGGWRQHGEAALASSSQQQS